MPPESQVAKVASMYSLPGGAMKAIRGPTFLPIATITYMTLLICGLDLSSPKLLSQGFKIFSAFINCVDGIFGVQASRTM